MVFILCDTIHFMPKKFLRPELFIYISLVFFLGMFFILSLYSEDVSEVSDDRLLQYYLKSTTDKLLWSALILFFVFYIRVGFFLIIVHIKRSFPPAVFSWQQMLVYLKKSFSRVAKDLLQAGIPFVLAFFTLTLAIRQLNVFNAARLQDELLVGWDIFLTHTFLPFTIASIHYPAWFVTAVDFSFGYLGGILALFAAYLFQTRQSLFREAGGAFFLGLMIMFIGWMLFPALSPQDRFLDNIYELPVEESIEPYMAAYHPQEEITVFLEEVRGQKALLQFLPTTTMPSAHVAWALLLVYYSYRAFRWLIVLFLPFAILSSIGTVLFAQHYFVDIPAGIAIGFLSIWVARRLAMWKEDSSPTKA